MALLEGYILVGVHTTSLEEGYNCRELIYIQATPSVSVHFLLPSDQDVEFSVTSSAPCLSHTSKANHDHNELNL